jgi:hypothetical protein
MAHKGIFLFMRQDLQDHQDIFFAFPQSGLRFLIFIPSGRRLKGE